MGHLRGPPSTFNHSLSQYFEFWSIGMMSFMTSWEIFQTVEEVKYFGCPVLYEYFIISYCPKFWRLCWENNLFGAHRSFEMKLLNNDLLYASFWRPFYHLLCWRRLTQKHKNKTDRKHSHIEICFNISHISQLTNIGKSASLTWKCRDLVASSL